MAYEKHTWETNEVITASKMNNIEEGIAENEGKIAVLETSIGENSTTIGSINSNISDVNSRLVSVENTYVNEQVFLASLDAVRDMTVSVLPNQELSPEAQAAARENIHAFAEGSGELIANYIEDVYNSLNSVIKDHYISKPYTFLWEMGDYTTSSESYSHLEVEDWIEIKENNQLNIHINDDNYLAEVRFYNDKSTSSSYTNVNSSNGIWNTNFVFNAETAGYIAIILKKQNGTFSYDEIYGGLDDVINISIRMPLIGPANNLYIDYEQKTASEMINKLNTQMNDSSEDFRILSSSYYFKKKILPSWTTGYYNDNLTQYTNDSKYACIVLNDWVELKESTKTFFTVDGFSDYEIKIKISRAKNTGQYMYDLIPIKTVENDNGWINGNFIYAPDALTTESYYACIIVKKSNNGTFTTNEINNLNSSIEIYFNQPLTGDLNDFKENDSYITIAERLRRIETQLADIQQRL